MSRYIFDLYRALLRYKYRIDELYIFLSPGGRAVIASKRLRARIQKERVSIQQFFDGLNDEKMGG